MLRSDLLPRPPPGLHHLRLAWEDEAATVSFIAPLLYRKKAICKGACKMCPARVKMRVRIKFYSIASTSGKSYLMLILFEFVVY